MGRWIERLLEALGVIAAIGIGASNPNLERKWFVLSALLYGVATPVRLWYKSWNTRTSKEIAIQSLLRNFAWALFDESRPDLCMTILLPNRRGKYIRPEYRFSSYASGGIKSRCKSKARFEMKTALAGYAWRNPRKLYTRGDIGPFVSREEFEDFYTKTFEMPPKLVKRLNYDRLKDVQSLLCWGIVDREDRVCGVLSVDSIEREAFDDIDEEALVVYVSTLASVLLDVPK